MTEATEPLMTRVEDIPKKLDAILEQLTILSGVAASASRTEKAEARKISSKKVDRAYVKKQEETTTVFKEMNKNMERLVKMQEVQEKMLKAQESRQKKTASDIGRKGREKQKTNNIDKLQKMTLEQQEEYWKLKEKALKTQMKADKKLNKLQQKYERRRNLKDKIKGLPSDVMQGLGSDFSPSNFLLALGPLGFAAKMISDQTGAGKKLAGSLKQFIPGMRDKDRGGGGRGGNPKEELEKIKYQRWFQKKLGTTKDKYYRQQIGRGSGLKVSESGMLEMDEESLQKKAIAYQGGSKKKVSRGAIQKQAQIADTSKKTGKPTDQQIRKSVTGRPIMWLQQRLEKSEGGDKGGAKIPGVTGGGGLLGAILPLLGLLAGGAVGLIKGIIKGIRGKKDAPKKGTPTSKKGGKSPNKKITQQNQIAQKTAASRKESLTKQKANQSPSKSKAPPAIKTPPKKPGKFPSMRLGPLGWTTGWAGLAALQGASADEVANVALTTTAYQLAQSGVEKIVDKGVTKLVEKGLMGAGARTVLGVAGSALSGVGMAFMVKDAFDIAADIGARNMAKKKQHLKETTKRDDLTGKLTRLSPLEILNAEVGDFFQDFILTLEEAKETVPEELNSLLSKARQGVISGDTSNLSDKEIIMLNKMMPKLVQAAKEADSSPMVKRVLRQAVELYAAEGRGASTREAYRKVTGGREGPLGPSGIYASQGWFRENKMQTSMFNQSNDAVKEPEKADDLLAGPKGNFTFNARDKHYALPDGQILSTNRGINTLPESRGIQANRFSGGTTGGEDQTAQILQQILAALQKGGTGNAAVINNTTRLISPENFASGGVFV